MFDDNKAEMAKLVRAAIEPSLVGGEELLGSLYATKKSSFSAKVFAIGATADRLILVEVDRKIQPKGPAVTIRRTDITKSSIDGWGGGMSHFLASVGEAPQIRFDTANEKYKFYVVGGITGKSLMGEDYMSGLEAVCSFIAQPA